jgi:hypothetical protein
MPPSTTLIPDVLRVQRTNFVLDEIVAESAL